MSNEETQASAHATLTNLPEKILRRLNAKGLHLPGKPRQDLPEIGDITRYTAEELGRLLSLFTAYHAYAVGQLALAEVDEMASERLLDRALIEAMAQAEGKTLAHQRLVRDQDAEVQKLRYKLLECKSTRQLLKAMAEGLERHLSLVSREITRRGQTEAWEHREHRMGNATT